MLGTVNVQYKNLDNWGRLTIFFIKLMVISYCLYYLFFLIHDKWHFLSASMKNIFFENELILIIVVLLMPLNWLTESLKWYLLCQRVSPQISFMQAFKSILTGLSLNHIIPMGLGKLSGRVLAIQFGKKTDLIKAHILNQSSQFSTTLTFGLVSVGFFFYEEIKTNMPTILICIFSVVSFFFFYIKKYSVSILAKYQQLKHKIKFKDVGINLFLSMVRFNIFSFQMFLLFKIAGIALPDFVVYFGVCWVMLFKTIIPSFTFLSDLGIREFSAILFFESYDVMPVMVLSATLIIWGINILIPSILGAFFILQLKILKKC